MSDRTSSSKEPYVLALPSWYPNLQDEADGNFIEKHLQAIAEDVNVIALFVKGIEGRNYPERMEDRSGRLTVIRRYYRKRSGLFGKILNVRSFLKIQKREFEEIRSGMGDPMLTHVHVVGRSSLLAIELKKSYSIPLLISEHWGGYYPESEKMGSFKRKLIRHVIAKSNAITAVSESLANAIRDVTGVKDIQIIPNIVDDAFFTPVIGEKVDGAIQILHVSNMVNIKGVDDIIRTANRLAEKQDLFLTLVGDGPEGNKLKKLAGEMKNLEGKYRFTGDISQGEIAGLLQTASFSVLNSRYESQSVVLLESIAMGVPILAPAVGGLVEHFSNKGILFDPMEENALFRSMDEMIQRHGEWKAEDLRDYAMQHFSKERIKKDFSRLYKDLA